MAVYIAVGHIVRARRGGSGGGDTERERHTWKVGLRRGLGLEIGCGHRVGLGTGLVRGGKGWSGVVSLDGGSQGLLQ